MRTFTLAEDGRKIAVNPAHVTDVEVNRSDVTRTSITIMHGAGNTVRVVREAFPDVVRELSL